MANPICLSPLKFYDDVAKQSHRKSYAYENISPLITALNWIPPFQFVIPDWKYNNGGGLSEVLLFNAKTDEVVTDLSQVFSANDSDFSIKDVENYKVAVYSGKNPIPASYNIPEGYYYLKIISNNGGVWSYYSEVFCFSQITKDCIEIEYWNEVNDFYLKNGIITFSDNFHFKLLLKTEIGKPEYNFEEESTKRLGYNFIESQVSKKIYKFSIIAPEFICDAMRLIRLCDNKFIRCNDDEYEAITFEMDVDWQTQGDLALITCEFGTDNVIVNIGGFRPDKLGGDFNNDYNTDFDNQ